MTRRTGKLVPAARPHVATMTFSMPLSQVSATLSRSYVLRLASTTISNETPLISKELVLKMKPTLKFYSTGNFFFQIAVNASWGAS